MVLGQKYRLRSRALVLGPACAHCSLRHQNSNWVRKAEFIFFKNGCWDPLTRRMPERRGLQCRRSQTPKGVSNTTAHPSQQTNQAFICLSVGFSVCKMWVRSSPLDRRIADITFINLLMPLNHLPRDLRSPGSYTCAPSPTPAHLRAVRLVPAVWSLSAGRTSGC